MEKQFNSQKKALDFIAREYFKTLGRYELGEVPTVGGDPHVMPSPWGARAYILTELKKREPQVYDDTIHRTFVEIAIEKTREYLERNKYDRNEKIMEAELKDLENRGKRFKKRGEYASISIIPKKRYIGGETAEASRVRKRREPRIREEKEQETHLKARLKIMEDMLLGSDEKRGEKRKEPEKGSTEE
jgi:hypothetical protein